MKKLLISILFIVPTIALAASPVAGTNDYLKSLGYTDAQLTEHVATEDREFFETAEGTGSVSDPFGDVVSRWGETSAIHNAWGDISDVTLSKNDTTQTWDFVMTLGGDVPEKLADKQKAQWFTYMDLDDDISNNAIDGIRAGMDAEFSVQYNNEHGWYADFRWFNNVTDFWAVNKETAAAYELNGNTLILRVPFAEAPSTLAPHWRTAMGIVEGSDMQLDVAPGIGFPPPKGETYPTDESGSAYSDASDLWVGGIAAAVIVAYGAFQWVAKKRQT
ncbi:hypothetical protein EBS80_01655 [bacterium]|nr:hypothetical protein [bacterium]